MLDGTISSICIPEIIIQLREYPGVVQSMCSYAQQQITTIITRLILHQLLINKKFKGKKETEKYVQQP